MRNITAQSALHSQLEECGKCKAYFLDNVPLIADEYGLTEAQTVILAIHINEHHKADHVVH